MQLNNVIGSRMMIILELTPADLETKLYMLCFKYN